MNPDLQKKLAIFYYNKLSSLLGFSTTFFSAEAQQQTFNLNNNLTNKLSSLLGFSTTFFSAEAQQQTLLLIKTYLKPYLIYLQLH